MKLRLQSLVPFSWSTKSILDILNHSIIQLPQCFYSKLMNDHFKTIQVLFEIASYLENEHAFTNIQPLRYDTLFKNLVQENKKELLEL